MHDLGTDTGRGGNSQSQQGDEDDEGDVEPVDMLVPVLEGDGLLGDVWLLQVVLLSASWFVVDSAVWEGRSLGLSRWCGGGHVERDCVVRTVDAQDKPPSVCVRIPRTLKGCVWDDGGVVVWVRGEG